MILRDFTRGISSGVTLAKVALRTVLPGLYLSNNKGHRKLPLVYDGDFPTLSPQAYDEYLDMLGSSFEVERLVGESDDDYRERILFSIGRNTTISGIKRSVEFMFGYDPVILRNENRQEPIVSVDVVETYEDFCDGATTSFDHPIRDQRSGSLMFGFTVIISPLPERITCLGGVDLPPHKIFYRPRSLYHQKYLDIFKAANFKFLLSDLAAAGVEVQKVIIEEPGAGGVRRPQYV